MQRSHRYHRLGVLFLLGALSGVSALAQLPRTSGVIGVVRNRDGVPQMGVVVQALLSGSVVSGSALTDLQGRYVIHNLTPGRYSILAAGVLFTPAVHRRLSLSGGTQTTVNLTLTSFGDPSAWLREQQRTVNEPSDDWKWTLRSPANRPLLRVLGEEDADSTASAEAPASRPQSHTRLATTDGLGGFARAGHAQTITETVSRRKTYLAQTSFEARRSRAPDGQMVSEHLTADFIKSLGLSGEYRAVASFESHPELLAGDGTSGLRSLRVATARQFPIGPVGQLDVGSLVDAVPSRGFLQANPFFSLALQPSTAWSAGYGFATSRAAQSSADLGAVTSDVPTVVGSAHHLREARQLHQEVFVERRGHNRRVRITYYRDASGSVLVSGLQFPAAHSGMSQEPVSLPAGSSDILIDTSSAAFRTLAKVSSSQGMSVQVLGSVGPGLWLALSYDLGTTPVSGNDLQHLLGAGTWRQMRSHALRVDLVRSLGATGAKLKTSYRWQPSEALVDVNPFQSSRDEAYLGFHLRQPLRCQHLLPDGVELLADGSNVLAQGYRRSVLDGQTFFLAGTPRVITAGLSVTF